MLDSQFHDLGMGPTHIQIGHRDILAIGDERVPELGLAPGYSVNQNIRRSPYGQVDRPSFTIAPTPILIDPSLAVSIEKSFTMTSQGNICPA